MTTLPNGKYTIVNKHDVKTLVIVQDDDIYLDGMGSFSATPVWSVDELPSELIIRERLQSDLTHNPGYHTSNE